MSTAAQIRQAIPFWMSLLLIPLAVLGAMLGGWTVVLLPIFTWYFFSLLDAMLGLNADNLDLESDTRWYRAITLVWAPVQFVLLFWMIWYVPQAAHLGTLETIVLFFGVGVITGTIGITYAHELMHQKPKVERWMGDLLLAMVLYSHFRSEHLQVHHRHVATPRDTVTARYNEGFHRFFFRVLPQSAKSAFRAEAAMLARKGRKWTHLSNPFFRYWALQAAMLAFALILGGWVGLALFLWQALVAIWQLELVNYVEHYGLTREHLGGGKYEHVKPRHSWNATHKATNWLLINLQRHSDHHYKPDRRFPLLQNYSEDDAPQLPYGYPIMTTAAMVPPLWRRVMNRRVRAWRKTHYPQITDWQPYNKASNPPPA
ncbi:alkane 1-monooxygenase [Roseovarius sp. Pro17]|uniref:alkane 1-monooxygenase n=1 Tax=Roseovarius sp. Pro17 TaxID=3108175 RepID=UPI002D782AA7|nr:alkane 1-monooxygenase [Roseovarius sp. Pro17]